MFKKVLAVVVVVVAVFALVACSGNLNGTWECGRLHAGGNTGDAIRFQGNTFTEIYYDDGVRTYGDTGTFSVSGDRIEAICDCCNRRRSDSFSRNGNVISIGRDNFHRR